MHLELWSSILWSLFKSWSSCFLICYMHSEEQNFNEVKNTIQDTDFFMQKTNVFTASLSTLTASPECLTLWNWNCSWSHHFYFCGTFSVFLVFSWITKAFPLTRRVCSWLLWSINMLGKMILKQMLLSHYTDINPIGTSYRS